MKDFIMFAGPNGSGKSTVRDTIVNPVEVVIDPDRIARELNPSEPKKAENESGREAIRRFNEAIESGRSLSMETTLTGHSAVQRHHDLGGAVTYHGKKVLSTWEQRAIKTLMDQLSPELHLCPQVRLADIVNVESADRSAWRSAFNRIACKSVDFVVMDLLTGTPIMVIELDDRSHSRSDRRERDALVDRVLCEASIPLVRFKPFGKLDIRPHLSEYESV